MHTRLLNLQGLNVHCRLPSEGLLCYRGAIYYLSAETYRERVHNCIMHLVPLFMGNKKHNEMISQCIDESFLFRYVLGFFLLSCPHPFPLNNHPLSTQKSLQS